MLGLSCARYIVSNSTLYPRLWQIRLTGRGHIFYPDTRTLSEAQVPDGRRAQRLDASSNGAEDGHGDGMADYGRCRVSGKWEVLVSIPYWHTHGNIWLHHYICPTTYEYD